MGPTGKRVGPVPQLTSPVGPNEKHSDEEGFTLLEVVCVVAILAIIAALIPPILSPGTSRAKLQSYAVKTAALLKSDRNAALRRQVQVASDIDVKSRWIRSGASKRVVKFPDDVTVDFLFAVDCNRDADRTTIRFFPSGMSCGGVIALSHLDYGYQIRVNWLTGGIEIAALNPA
jgi:general secretion pathway protein H